MDTIPEIRFSNPKAIDRLFTLRRAEKICWRSLGVGVALASFATDASGIAWPSRLTLANIVGVDPRNISVAIRELESAGFLAREIRAGQSNVYRLTLDGCDALDDSDARITTIKTPCQDHQGGIDGCDAGALMAVMPITINEQLMNNETITTSLFSETSIPKDKPKDKSIPQGNTTPPLIPAPSPSPASGKRKPKPKPNQHPTWRLWLQVNQDARQPTPLEEKASLAAARKLAAQIPAVGEQEQIMLAYIEDKTDAWAIRQGLTLAVLVNSRLSKCRTVAARAIEEQAAEDTDLIRQAMETFPDPDERADFFYQRSLRGLRVPPGVDCRPMPAQKEVAV